MVFTTIYVTGEVSPRDYRRVLRARGQGAAEKRAMTELIETAGFVSVREQNATRAFAQTTRAFMETSARYRDELRAEWGASKFEESQRNRATTLALIDEGVLRRAVFTARRPARQ